MKVRFDRNQHRNLISWLKEVVKVDSRFICKVVGLVLVCHNE